MTNYSTENPCPVGTYNPSQYSTSIYDCIACDPGKYCSVEGLTAPQGLCSPGWYCIEGATSPQPDSFNPDQGGQCLPGEYCPEGSFTPMHCDPGFYCSMPGLSNVTGPCSAGHYCIEGSFSADPTDNVVGGICPPGNYCPAQSVLPLKCPPGTYLDSVGNSMRSHCKHCKSGSYCGSSGLSLPEGLCREGFYCPGGQTTPTPNEYICVAGHFCGSGSSTPVRCPSGTYQDEMGMASCKVCLAGYFCNSSMEPVINFDGRLCPEGYYCPNGTEFAMEYPCPLGSFSNLTGLVSKDECQPCLPGQYCSSLALTSPVGSCLAGYYCQQGATSPTPLQGVNANICPQGSFCPVKSSQPNPCPVGTFSNVTGVQSIEECSYCTGGYACTTTGLTAPDMECIEGYHCPLGSFSSTQLPCPVGHYCMRMSAYPVACPLGTYSPEIHNSNISYCISCSPGMFCDRPGLDSPSGNCSSGYYCPKSQITPQPIQFVCPVGFHCPIGSSSPHQCPPGQFANISGASTCEACPIGFFCLPIFSLYELAYSPCPEGYFCPGGTGLDWIPCPAGTYSNQTGLYNQDQCIECDGGMYCSDSAATSPTGECYAGFFCTSGTDRPNPVSEQYSALSQNYLFANGNVSYNRTDCMLNKHLTNRIGIGGPCPPGHFCTNGTVFPHGCPAGTFNSLSGQSECVVCPPGYYCPANTSILTEYLECPKGYYCPKGTPYPYTYPCPLQTFNNQTAQISMSACLLCLPGMYCSGEGLAEPSGLCASGWFCILGSRSSQPTVAEEGGVCEPGFYCPLGSYQPLSCPPGNFCQTPGLEMPSGICSAGYYCSSSSVTPVPEVTDETGGPCPSGHYCQKNSPYPQPCPLGTFLNATHGQDLLDCIDCIEGYYCSEYGLVQPSGICSEGYYCPPGQLSPTPSLYICPNGHYCPYGSHEPLLCEPGSHQNVTGMTTCLSCPAGFYCDSFNSSLFEPQLCPKGHYCPTGTKYASQFPCPIGTFNNHTGSSEQSQCHACPGRYYCSTPGLAFPSELCSPGYFCRLGAASAAPTQDTGDAGLCPPGYFCPLGTEAPKPCPKGTFSTKSMLSTEEQCTLCTAGSYCNSTALTEPNSLCEEGYFCPLGSIFAFNKSCPPGHYCPSGSAYPTACSAGTFSPLVHLSVEAECQNCTSGMFCNTSALTEPSGPCKAGYYCPTGSSESSPSDFFCPIGYVCPEASASPQLCPSGWFTNSTHRYNCSVCPPGFFCTPQLIIENSIAYQSCPAGFYCPEGTGFDWIPCPVGTYSNTTGLYQSSQCSVCDGGMYCTHLNATAVTGRCYPGYFCTSGNIHPDPLQGSYCGNISLNLITPVGGLCPVAHYCPSGSSLPMPCPKGTYSNQSGLSECMICPTGYYCPRETSDIFLFDCPEGYFCPPGTEQPYQFPCPPGTYYNFTNAQSVYFCIGCPGGYYCESPGLSEPTGLCTEGWYCSSDATQSTPLDPLYGGPCPIGFYCPVGSQSPIPCTEGMYCSSVGLVMPEGNCSEGYYCPLSSNNSRPANYVCPSGHFCLTASAYPTPCPVGSYLNSTGNCNIQDCLNCTLGMYCDSYGLAIPSGLCSAGYFCPGGQESPNPFKYVCPEGHFCVTGSFEPQPCPPGTYQDATAQQNCSMCPSGYYCDPSENGEFPIISFISFVCPEGYFCPKGTKSARENPCPLGTFSNITGLLSESQCQPCLGGYYCGERALSFPTTLCSFGYYCKSGADRATPALGNLANICPTGSYCPEGSVHPVPCPIGTYSNVSGLWNEEQCTPCTPGFYCDAPGIVEETGPCAPKYFCSGGAKNAFWEECPAGYFCPPKSTLPEPCPKGTFSNTSGLLEAVECFSCTPGMYCAESGLTEPTGDCSTGYYCLKGSVSPAEFICPAGLYCPEGSIRPLECHGGSYTNATGVGECSICPPGFFCLTVNADYSELPYAAVNTSVNVQLCPPGYYCPEGIGVNWQPCPIGTYSAAYGLASANECTLCNGGMYCDSPHLTEPTGDCLGGHFCSFGNFLSNPSYLSSNLTTDFTFVGGICPPQTYCPNGTEIPLPCLEGTFNNLEGQVSCKMCPAGFYCPPSTDDYTSYTCPSGHVCPEGTEYANQFPCPPGTFNPYYKQQKHSNCLQCPGGMFCENAGLSNATGPCSAGYYCILGSSSSAPLNESGGICPIGHYCPEGSTVPTECDPGTYCATEGLDTPQGPCSPGYYCSLGAYTPLPTDNSTGDICPSGFYCPESSDRPQPCPQGHFVGYSGASHVVECQLCISGMFCSQFGLSTPEGECDQGFFCPEGQVSQRPEQFTCPEGNFCPIGSSLPQPCPAGTYQNQLMQSECKLCPAGYFCSNSSGPVINYVMFECPVGHYCPYGTRYAFEYPCPIGTFSNLTGLQLAIECTPCTAGSVCDKFGLAEPSKLCGAGFFCVSGANQSAPFNTQTSGICPKGHYCPPGTVLPLPCLPGTFSDVAGLATAEECTPCTNGMFCVDFGLTEPSGFCLEGYYCPVGAVNSTDTLCPAGYYCINGSTLPTPCPAGTFSTLFGLTSRNECSPCPSGYYCSIPGLTGPTGLCSPGFYCPKGSHSISQFICTSGLHCPEGSSFPMECPFGTYTNISGSVFCELCEEGFFCIPATVNNPTENRFLCPAGYYCPEQTGTNWRPCPHGTYSNHIGLSKASQCLPCSAGMYCNVLAATSPTDFCSAGFFCTSGVVTPEPQDEASCSTNMMMSSGYPIVDESDVTDFPVIGGVCSVGHFCKEGSSTPSPCPAGTYNDITQQSNCTECPSGYFCLLGSITYLDTPCPVGHYCPTRTLQPIACPRGTFNNLTHAFNESHCLPCTPGMYCRSEHLSEPTGPCTEGYFCIEGASENMPSLPFGSICSPGEFCRSGSHAPSVCSAGYACTSFGLAAPDVSCAAGYFCPEGSILPDNIENVCPIGFFCPEGSMYPLACPVGTYSDLGGISEISSCIQCTAGFFCNSTALTVPTGICQEGYFCPPGQSVPNPSQYVCPQGHFCLDKSLAPVRCESGHYQDEIGQANCKVCPPSYFCDNRFLPVVLFNDSLCPVGYYCPIGTSFAYENPCPRGTFSNTSGLSTSKQCIPCFPGHFCGESGLVEPSGPCFAGHVCVAGSDSPTPQDSPCPAGHFCPYGTYDPIPCPMGTFSPNTRNTRVGDCMLCSPGHYCTGEGAVNTTNMLCSDGYICVEGAFTPTPMDNVTGYPCPAGHFCTNISLLEQECPPGMYQPDEGKPQCLSCPVGTICRTSGLVIYDVCPQGYYCPNSEMIIGLPCPLGTFSNITGNSNLSDCHLCPEGMFCNSLGLTKPSGLCEAGYLCVSGASSPSPRDGLNEPCPPGYFCKQGTTYPEPCPTGTMSPFVEISLNGVDSSLDLLLWFENTTSVPFVLTPAVGLRDVEDCLPCVGGFFCELLNSTKPTGPCLAGYYCPHNASIVQPNPDDYQCPLGFYCPKASSTPIACPSGTYSNTTMAVTCNVCPGGYFCNVGSIFPTLCPPRYFCPGGSSMPIFCPNGTYTSNTTFGLESKDQCTPCVRSHFCLAGEIAGVCSAGYICYQGSGVPTPDGSNPVIGEPCPEGFYCIEGSSSPTACSEGLFNVFPGGMSPDDCTICPQGRVCRNGSQLAEVCPRGFFCMNGSAFPCPPGTYSSELKAEDVSFCLPCEPGFLCSEEATVAYDQTPCPVGQYCESGSFAPIACPSGTHRNETAGRNVTDCFPCPAGFYCAVNGTVHGIPCDISESCPKGTINAIPCPPGFYCPVPGVRLPCPPGYYCPEGSTYFIACPSDHYCKQPMCERMFLDQAGAHRPTICPLGYREIVNVGENFTRDSLNSTCEKCPAGTYMNASSLVEERECLPCPPGFYCVGGSTFGDPGISPVLFAYVCPQGHYCPTGDPFGSSDPIPCPVGTYNAYEGHSSLADCIPCSQNEYNNMTGQPGCLLCPSESNTLGNGSTSCNCIGSNKIFQVFSSFKT